MSNIFNSLEKSYEKTSKYFNEINIIFFIFIIGMLIVVVINNTGNERTDNTFQCYLTPIDEVIEMDTSQLKTVMALSLINTSTQLFKTNLTKNEVPAIENPRFGSFSDISICMDINELVYVVNINNVVKIYPRKLLEQHIAVNDLFNETPILITYSPLADHFAVYKREINGEPLLFGVSGYLYKNIDLIYDSKTESLWSQLDGRALVGTQIGASLEKLKYSERMKFSDAIIKYPTALYMNYDTGFRFNYNSNPFESYRSDNKVVEDVEFFSDKNPQKQDVIAFFIDSKPFYIYSNDLKQPYYNDVIVDDKTYIVEFNNDLIRIFEKNTNNIINTFSIYWFAWYDNYPNTSNFIDNEF